MKVFAIHDGTNWYLYELNNTQLGKAVAGPFATFAAAKAYAKQRGWVIQQ